MGESFFEFAVPQVALLCHGGMISNGLLFCQGLNISRIIGKRPSFFSM